MDVLKDKQTKTYNALSRYSSIPFYYHTLDNKFIYGLTKQLSTDTDYTIHTVALNDTLDSLALKYYGRPDYYWIIADFNRIQDPMISLYAKYKTIKIPSISYIYYEDNINGE